MALRTTAFTRRGPAGSRLLAVLVAASVVASGCSLFGDDAESKPGTRTLRMNFNNFPVLDPQVVTDGMWLAERGILEPLVMQNDKGTDVIAATSDKWEESADGKTYTFHIRDNAKWSNGNPVTAQDFERTYKRLLTPSSSGSGGTTLGANSYQAALGIKGATQHLSGTLKDWSQVGVKATGERELTFTLATPNPGFLMGLTHPSMLPLHMDTVDKMPQAWQEPANLVTNGPYMVKEWTKNSSMKLVPNPHYWDKGNAKLDMIDIKFVEPGSPVNAVPFENGEIDVMSVADADLLRFQNDPKLSKMLQTVKARGYIYLAKLRSENPVLEDVRVRKALSLAMGRENLAKVSPGLRPGYALIFESLPGYDTSLGIKEDIAEAKRLLTEAGYPDGKGLPEIKILSGSTSPVVEAIVDSWKRNLGIQAKADVVEVGVYVQRRWQVQKSDYVGFYFGSFSGLQTWPVTVQTLWSPKNIQEFSLAPAVWAQYQAIQNDKALTPADRTKKLDDLLAANASAASKEMAVLANQANTTTDKAKQVDLYKQAAKLREEQYLILPVLFTDVVYAVQTNVEGLHLRPAPDFFYFKGITIKDSK